MSKRDSTLPALLRELRAAEKLFRTADEGNALHRRKAAKATDARKRKALLATSRKYKAQMTRLYATEARIVDRILSRPITSLADVRGILEFMGHYCQELVPCPSNDRKGDLTRSYDSLVVAVGQIAERLAAMA